MVNMKKAEFIVFTTHRKSCIMSVSYTHLDVYKRQVLDCLGYLKEIPVCVGYEIDGEVVKDFPVTAKLAKAKPVYKVLPGWNCDISGIKEYDKLPKECRDYIEFIEKEIGVPIKMVSNGPKRHDIIHRA